jgi:hypothetical protein
MNSPSVLNPRFDYIAENIPDALDYYRNRATQLLSAGWSWDGSYIDLGWGIQVSLFKDDVEYQSVYVFEKHKGHLPRWFAESERNFVTMASCHDMYKYMMRKDISFTIAFAEYSQSHEYMCVEEFYRGQRAERTGVFYMNHIDEGLYILKALGANWRTKSCFCLHPLFQSDAAIAKKWGDVSKHSPEMIVLAMEYRNIANAYLPKRKINGIDEINLSPIEAVNVALRADKIQNRKDFEKYHLGTHPNSDGLVKYFDNWFKRLGITEEFYQRMVAEIETKTGQNV